MARDKGKAGPVTRALTRYLVGKDGQRDVTSPEVDQELRDITDGKTPPPPGKGGAR